MCNSNRSPYSCQNYQIVLKIEHPVTYLATMPYVYAACPVHITIFSTGGKFQPVSNFMELHALTLAAQSYVVYKKVKHLEEVAPQLHCPFRSSSIPHSVCILIPGPPPQFALLAVWKILQVMKLGGAWEWGHTSPDPNPYSTTMKDTYSMADKSTLAFEQVVRIHC